MKYSDEIRWYRGANRWNNGATRYGKKYLLRTILGQIKMFKMNKQEPFHPKKLKDDFSKSMDKEST